MGVNLILLRMMAITVAVASVFSNSTSYAQSNVSAKKLFSSQILPADLKPQVYGGYTRGCIAGAQTIPVDGPNWQAMRLSRNRHWGHPRLLQIIEELSVKAADKGWNGLLVGDMSQPRGGPSPGHRSHQIGLDVDIWFTPMPEKRFSFKEREKTSAVSMLKKGSFYVDDNKWSQSRTELLKAAAQFPEVERLLVHPGIKKKLCDTVKGDRSWLSKVRPFWGHMYHFHMRIGCPAGSPGCKSQNAAPKADGCDKSLAWWFKSGLAPKKKAKAPTVVKKKPVKRKQMLLSSLPRACETVLNAAPRDLAAATLKVSDLSFAAPQIDMPIFDANKVLNSKARTSTKKPASIAVAIPTKRPAS
ncbi:MAG: penicillin-insensitive murein endopeptidase [Rhizobiaceae bacterium]|nr:penicillin-insensitive murein endopeptidase [Rhizobiaceae bacterium]